MKDQELYQLFRAGDNTAMVALVERYHQPIFDFLYRFTNNQTLADDLCQEVFIRLMHNNSNHLKNVRSWLYTVARNSAVDFFRSAYHRREQSTNFEADIYRSSTPSPEQRFMIQESASQVGDALQSLPDEQRDVVILRFYHDLSLNEIAEVTGAPLGTVKSRLFHGLKKLKERLKATEGSLR